MYEYYNKIVLISNYFGLKILIKVIIVFILTKLKIIKIISSEIRWNWANDFEMMWVIRDINKYGLNIYFKILDESSINKLNNFYEVGIDFKDEVFIDIGSGIRGFLPVIIAKEKICIDPILDKFKDQFILSKNIIYSSSKAENIMLPSNYADVIACHNVLNHTKNPNKVLNEIYRILKPNGILLFQVILQRESLPHTYEFKYKEIKDKLNSIFIVVREKYIKYKDNDKIMQYGGVFRK